MSSGWPIRLTAMSALWGGLVLWSILSGRPGCAIGAVFLLLLSLVLMLSMAEISFYRRRAFLARYLVAEGRLHRLLGRRILLVVWQGFKALLLGFLLLIGVLALEPPEWAVLLVDIPVLATLTASLSVLLRGEVQDVYRMPMARHWALRLNTFLLWSALVLVNFYSPHEDYAGLRWDEVAVSGAARVEVGCELLAIPARLAGIGEALVFWAAQNLLGGLEQPAQAALSWLVFVAAFGVSFLLAWAYGRALAGTLSRPWRIRPAASGTADKDEPISNPAESGNRRLGRWFWTGFAGIIFIGLIIALLAAVRSGQQLVETGLNQSGLPAAPSRVIRVIWFGGETVYLDDASLSRVQAEMKNRIRLRRDQAERELASGLNQGLESIFGQLSARIPAFADWYYSLEGEYVRLFHAAAGDLADHLEEKANELIFEPSGAADAIDNLAEHLGAAGAGRIRSAALDLKNLLTGLVAEKSAVPAGVEVEVVGEWHLGRQLGDHLEPYVSLGPADIARQGVATTAGATASALTLKKLGGAAVAKAAGKVGAKTSLGMLAGLAGKLGLKSAAKAGGALSGAGTGAFTGAALCAGTGVGAAAAPGCALLGGVITGVGVWLLVDKAVIEAEEYLHRDDLESDLRQTLEQEREALQALLHARYIGALESAFEELSNAMETQVRPQPVTPKKDFVPARR